MVLGAVMSMIGGRHSQKAHDRAEAYNRWRDAEDRRLAQKEYQEKRIRTEEIMAKSAQDALAAGQRAGQPLLAQAVELQRGASMGGEQLALQLQDALRKQSGATQQMAMAGDPTVSSRLGILNNLYSGQALLAQQQARLGRYERMTALGTQARSSAAQSIMTGVGQATQANITGMGTLAQLTGLYKTQYQKSPISPRGQMYAAIGSQMMESGTGDFSSIMGMFA